MKKKRMGRKLLSFLLTLAMVMGLMPGMSLTAFAESKNMTLNAVFVKGDTIQCGDGVYFNSYNAKCKMTGNVSITYINPPSNNSFQVSVDPQYEIVSSGNKGWSFYLTNYESGTATSELNAFKVIGGNGTSDSPFELQAIKYVPPVAVTNVTLPATATLTVDGDAVALTAAVEPGNATDKTVNWSVGGTNADAVKLYTDEACTTGNEVGTAATDKLTVYAKGISAGSATVTATSNADNTKTASCAVTVKAAQTITASDVTATYGDNDKSVSASVTTPATGGGAISYTVKDGSVDYIDVASDGKLTIKKVPASGKAYVIVKAAATDDYAETTKEVTVTIAKADPVTPTGITAKYGDDTGKIKLPEGWTWNDWHYFETVGKDTVKADFAGNDNYNNKTGVDITVEVGKADVAISYEKTEVSVEYGAEFGKNEITNPGNAEPTFTSSNKSVATVSDSGYVTIKGLGETTITATIKDDEHYHYTTTEASYKLTVNPVTTVVNTAPTAAELTYGQKLSESTLKGGEAVSHGRSVAGTFAWKEPDFVPNASESGEYDVVFTPTDTHYAKSTSKVTIKVNKKTVSATDLEDAQKPVAKTGDDVVYTGEPIELVTAPPADLPLDYEAYYSTDNGETWSTDIPKKTDPGTYTVKIKYVSKGGNCNDIILDDITATITPADKKALTDAITAAKTYYDTIKDNPDYSDAADKLDKAIKAAEEVAAKDKVTKSDVSTATNAVNTAKTTAETEVKDIDDTKAAQAVSDKIAALPAKDAVTKEDKAAIEEARAAYNALTEAQKAKVTPDTFKKLTDDEDKLAVLQAMSEVSAKTGSSVTYTGNPIQLINAPTTKLPEGYKMVYAVTTENTAPTDEKLYTTEIPTATDTGTYYVWYMVKGDENHNDTVPQMIEITIDTLVLDEANDWNLYEDPSAQQFLIKGAKAQGTVENSNERSKEYYDAKLEGAIVTVSVKGDRKKAAKKANATLEFKLADGSVVEFSLPVSYVKPEFKLTSASGTIKEGAESVLKTGIMVKGDGRIFRPYDMTGVTVSGTGAGSASKGADGSIEVKAAEAGKVTISISKEGWDDSDPVTLTYTVKAVARDVLDIYPAITSVVVLNSNAKGQTFSYDVTLNGAAPAEGAVEIIDDKSSGLAAIKDGKLVIAYREGVKAGKYTITLKAGEAAKKVNIRVSDKVLNKAVKLETLRRYDVVTGLSMVVRATLKDVGGTVESVTVAEEGFTARPSGNGTIHIGYSGDKYNKRNLKIGKLTLSLKISGIEEPVTITMKNVKAKTRIPSVKAATVIIPEDQTTAEGGVIGTANIVSSVYLSYGRYIILEPVGAKIMGSKNVTARVNESDFKEINIEKLKKKSGWVKVKLTYAGGVTKTIKIKVKRAGK